MHSFIYALILCLLFPTTLVLGQTPPSVTDTITLNFDTIALPKRGPNFSNYYGSGQKLFAVRRETNAASFSSINVYESIDFGANWGLKVENIIDFHAHDSVIIYNQYVRGNALNRNSYTGYEGKYKTFVSTDGGTSFALKNTHDVQTFNAVRANGCSDGYVNVQRLNDSVLIYGIDKRCDINSPTGFWGSPYAVISVDNGKNWGDRYGINRIPNFVVNNTAFRKRDSFLFFTKRADFEYNDSIKLLPTLPTTNIVGYSFASGIFSIYRHLAFINGLVYSTSDKGNTWRTDTLPFSLAASSQIVQVKDTVFLLGQNALYRSDNGNPRNFRRIYPQYPNNGTTYSGLSVVSSGIYLNGEDRALLRSSDGGNSWQIRNNTEGAVGNGKIRAFGEDIWFEDDAAMYHFEGTQSIARLDTFAGVPNFQSYSTGFRKDSLYLTAGNNYKMLRSLDKGFTWLPTSVDLFDPKSDSNRIYGVVSRNLFVISNDNAKTFTTYTTPERLWDVVIKKDKMWAIIGDLTESIRVVRSIDSGQTWTPVFRNISSLPYSLAIDEQKISFITLNGRYYQSTDEGATWTQMSEGLALNVPQIVRKKRYLFAYSMYDGGYCYVSKNEGITWTAINNVSSTLITDKYIYTSNANSIRNSLYNNIPQFKLARFPIDSLANKLTNSKTYSLLRGQILKDNNANCRQDATDAPFTAKMLRFNGSFNTSTDQNGCFNIMLPVDTYKIEVANERYYALRCGSDTASKRLIIRPNQTTDTTLFFQKIKSVRDIAVVLTANGRPRPANELEFVVHLKNLGTETVDSLRLQFDFSTLPVRLVSASPNAVQNGQKLTWLRRNFPSDAEELLKISVRIDTTAPLSTELRFYAQADILNQTDTFPNDNRDSARLTVVGSYDPNDKTVLPEGRIPLAESPKIFDYLIRFQNTGTDTAYKVVVVDALPELLDIHTLSVKSASHPYQLKVDKNVLTFTFDRIMLPDSFVNERASHGFIRFTINPKKRLAVETVDNSAKIFFDYNAPILTNTAQTNVYKPTIQTQKTVTLCAGARWQGIVYTRSTVLVDTLVKPFIDTIHTTFLDVKPTYYRQIDTTLRYGDTLFGQRMELNQVFIFRRYTVLGCDSTTVYNVVVVRPSAHTDAVISKIKITLSPNPVNDWLSIDYNLNKMVETEIYWINALGQKMGILKKKALDTEGGHTLQLDVRGVAAGVYQVILQTPNGIKTVIFSKI